MPQATLDTRSRVSPRREMRVSERLAHVIALRTADSNNSINSDHNSPRPDVRRRAFISTIGPKSALSRPTHPKNPQCGN